MVVLRRLRVLGRHFRNRIVLVFPILLIFVYFLKHLNDSAGIPLQIEIITDTSKPKVQSLIKITHYNHDLDTKSHDIQEHVEPRNTYFVPISMNKIDWHDYSRIKEDVKREGPGEQGLPASLQDKDKALEEALYSVNGFNGALSDTISLNRSLPDLRHYGCGSKTYLEHLPTVSVVVPFHNEHWSTLLRTVYSVLNRSPPQLLKEIFLVDDASTKEFLKRKLDDYIAKYLPKVHVIRLERRSGLITARLAGAKMVTSDVFVCLDSHTEATHNWLPPLLEPIALNPRTVVCPFIDIIAYDTFEYRIQDTGARGAFDWEFFYKRLPILPKDEKNMPEPFESPVMAGGLFAMSIKFFWELGGYDPGLDIWGGEQYELSFKIWQCGGRMLDAPCSRVGHIYRKYAPFPNPGHGDFVGKNYRRVAEVWMDEYAQYLYKRRPHYKNIDPGDISEQKALRKKLKCKPFKWFITQIAFDLPAKYPPVDPEPYALGKVRPAAHPNLCVDAHHGNSMDKLQLKPCAEHPAAEQNFIFGWFKDIKSKSRNMCWDLPDAKARSPVLLYACHSDMGNQGWRYYPETKQITHVDGNKCLAWDRPSLLLFVDECDETSAAQRWIVDKINESMMEKWDKNRLKVTGPVNMNE